MSTLKKILVCVAFGFAAIPSAAFAVPLSVVNVGSPAVNCVFNASCTVTVTDSIGNFPPATGYTGTPRLQSSTYDGQPGTPAAGKTAYVYRVDFTNATAATDINCATNMKIDFGPVASLPYAGSPAQVFVVTSGGLGTIGIASADQTGSIVTFTFTSPVCPANGQAPGQTTYFFGLAAATAPMASIAKVDLTYGGGTKNVDARVPAHKGFRRVMLRPM